MHNQEKLEKVLTRIQDSIERKHRAEVAEKAAFTLNVIKDMTGGYKPEPADFEIQGDGSIKWFGIQWWTSLDYGLSSEPTIQLWARVNNAPTAINNPTQLLSALESQVSHLKVVR